MAKHQDEKLIARWKNWWAMKWAEFVPEPESYRDEPEWDWSNPISWIAAGLVVSVVGLLLSGAWFVLTLLWTVFSALLTILERIML